VATNLNSVALYNIDRCILSILLQQLLHPGNRCGIFCRAMQGSSNILAAPRETQPTEITIEAVEIRLIRLPLLEPFETSFGKIDSRLIFLLSLEANGLRGWGEVVASEDPLYQL
jgi:hypothetical protein